MTTEITKDNMIDYIMAYEGGEIEYDDTIALFQYLVDTGMAWSLQGAYGRQAQALLDEGLIEYPTEVA